MTYWYALGLVALLAVAVASWTIGLSGVDEWLDDRVYGWIEHLAIVLFLVVAIAASAGVLVMIT